MRPARKSRGLTAHMKGEVAQLPPTVICQTCRGEKKVWGKDEHGRAVRVACDGPCKGRGVVRA